MFNIVSKYNEYVENIDMLTYVRFFDYNITF